MVAFSDDPQFATFRDRLKAYAGPVPDGQKNVPHLAYFDAITGIRPYGPDERGLPALRRFLAANGDITELRLDVQCWCPSNRDVALQWLGDLERVVVAADGRVANRYSNHQIGLLLARVYLPADRIADLGALDVVATIELLPRPLLSSEDIFSVDANAIGEIGSPSRTAPILGLIDSGISSAHPLIAGAVRAADSLSPSIHTGEDLHGHGTSVASLALHGPIDAALLQGIGRPIAQVVSVSVLNSQADFPDDVLWEAEVERAIEYCVEQGAKVINLSIGDATRPFRPPRQHAVSAVVDQLARLRDVVIVVAAGNCSPSEYVTTTGWDVGASYLTDMLNDAETTIIPPATAALALTVGGYVARVGTGAYGSSESPERRPYGQLGWPSSATRRGPGVGHAIKPELVAPAGTFAFNPSQTEIRDPELSIWAASTGGEGRLLRWDIGTSYAAPLVSRIALAVFARYPNFSANLVRALVLLGAQPTWYGEQLNVDKPGDRKAKVRELCGYGESSISGAIVVDGHRVILVAESEIAMDGMHVYEVPVPPSFKASGGTRYVDVALAFDPPVRGNRLDYLGNKLEFFLVRGLSQDQVVEAFSKIDHDSQESTADVPDADDYPDDVPDADLNVELETASEIEPVAGSTHPPRISDLGAKNIPFDTPATVRRNSTHQLGRTKFSTRFSSDAQLFLVVRSINNWTDTSEKQSYAIAVSLRRDEDQPEIFADLEAILESVVEVEIEPEIEVGGST